MTNKNLSQNEKTLAALAEYKIYSEEDLNRAMKKMKRLDITCMVVPLDSINKKLNGN